MTSTKKTVCVIGAGSSGLVVMKELQAVGHDFQCFEVLPHIGGVYLKSYQDTVLTTSSLLTAWSDHSDGKEKDPTFWTAEEYIDYLHKFAVKHDLLQRIMFNCVVQSIRKCEDTGTWLVTVLRGRPCKNMLRCEDVPEDQFAEPRVIEFDAIAVCTGTNTFASLPSFPGKEDFHGEILHSEEYVSPERFEGRKVLIVGAGESGSDIINEVSKVAASCGIAIRGKHGHILPRTQGNGRVSDVNTNRCRYSNPYVFGGLIGWLNQVTTQTLLSLEPDSEKKRILLKVDELNLQQKTSAFSKFGCKNEGFVSAMVVQGAQLFRNNFILQQDRAVFEDGSEFECDTVLACTGYRNAFPFFDEHHPELARAGQNPRGNFKQIFAIAFPGQVGFFGFARPAFGSIPPTVEIQARVWAMVINEELKLPGADEMRRVALRDQLEWERRFALDAHRVKGLVDYQIYCDGLAEMMGVMPPLAELLRTKPLLWLKIMCGPFTVHQYRLRGPYSDPVRAEQVLMRHPLGDLLETCITAFFLVLAKFLTLLGIPGFKPNSF